MVNIIVTMAVFAVCWSGYFGARPTDAKKAVDKVRNAFIKDEPAERSQRQTWSVSIWKKPRSNTPADTLENYSKFDEED